MGSSGGNNKPDWNHHPAILSMLTKDELVAFVETLFLEEGSMLRLGVSREKFRAYLFEVARNYHQVPYHNFYHAADTVHTVRWMVSQPVFAGNLSDRERFLLMFTALIHDVGHPGHNNQFEVQTETLLAKRYDNISVLENQSYDRTREMMEDPSRDIFSGVPDNAEGQWWPIIQELVLATDFSLHNQFLNDFAEYMALNGPDFSNAEFRSWISRALIKGADIANTAKPFTQAKAWGRRVMMEFWSQGVQEKEQNLVVGPLNDPDKVKMNNAQAGFIKFAAQELFELLLQVEPQFAPLVENLRQNLEYYEEMAEGRDFGIE